MDQETLAALKGSIRKWEDICLSHREDRGEENCPLCFLFFSESCDGCPVKNVTGLPVCDGSPYEPWRAHQKKHGGFSYYVRKDCEECRFLAERELEFLRSLLP